MDSSNPHKLSATVQANKLSATILNCQARPAVSFTRQKSGKPLPEAVSKVVLMGPWLGGQISKASDRVNRCHALLSLARLAHSLGKIRMLLKGPSMEHDAGAGMTWLEINQSSDRNHSPAFLTVPTTRVTTSTAPSGHLALSVRLRNLATMDAPED